MSKKLCLAILVVGAILSIFVFYITQIQFFEPTTRQSIFVQRVIDGDTVVLSSGARLRLIGIDAPEKGEPCFGESAEFLREQVSGKLVEIEFGAEQYDKYGRKLGHIFRGQSNINIAIADVGLAYAFPFESNTKYAEEFALAEQRAREQAKGCLWQEKP
tara:strand:- start:5845 stop:6321 length:477 start_codon:yes stop_codon:yes gene_type:complete